MSDKLWVAFSVTHHSIFTLSFSLKNVVQGKLKEVENLITLFTHFSSVKICFFQAQYDSTNKFSNSLKFFIQLEFIGSNNLSTKLAVHSTTFFKLIPFSQILSSKYFLNDKYKKLLLV